MLALAFEFLLKLFNGELFAIYKAHKTAEAIHDQNADTARSNADVSKQLSKWTRNGPDIL